MLVPSFTELVGDESLFFSDYFDRKPLLRRGALDASYQDLLTVADLDELLYSEALRPPHIQLSKDGAVVLSETYTQLMRVQDKYISDCVDPERVLGHFRSGATITWHFINHIRPGLRALTALFAERFAVRSDVTAFLTPAGHGGWHPHTDPVDLFIIQLHGTKHWRVWPTPEVRKGDAVHFEPGESGEPLFSTSLRPGDVMYVPYNTPHVAASEDTMSLHLTVLVNQRRWSDLLQRIVQVAVENDPVYWGYPYLNSSNRDELVRQLADSIAGLTSKLAATPLEQMVDDLIDWGIRSERSEIASPFADLAKSESLSEDSPIGIPHDNRVSVAAAGADGKAAVIVAGATYSMPSAIAARLSELISGEQVKAGEFIPGEPERSVRLVHSLVQIGAVRLRT